MKYRKIRTMVPNALTLGNLFCGFLAIDATINGDIKSATILIFIAIMLDSMDGRVARILGVSGDFGKQLDSLADIVSFGVVPAFMASYVFFDGNTVGVLLSGLFPLLGAYRLARFNVTPSDQSLNYFSGFPITLSGGLVVALTLFEAHLSQLVFAIIFLILGVLMVSRIKIPSFKKMKFSKSIFFVIIITLYLVYFILNPEKEGVPIVFYTAIAIFIFYLISKLLREKKKK